MIRKEVTMAKKKPVTKKKPIKETPKKKGK